MPARPTKMGAMARPAQNNNTTASTSDKNQSSSSEQQSKDKLQQQFKISNISNVSALPGKDDFFDPFFSNNNNTNTASAQQQQKSSNGNSNNMALPRQLPLGMEQPGRQRNNSSSNNNPYVLVADGQLRVGPDGISVTDPNNKDILPPVVRLEDLVEERVLDKTNERNVTLCRREDKNDPTVALKKERYAVKRLVIKNRRDTLHVVAAEVGSAFTNRSEFTVALRNAYLRGDELILIMEYMDGRSLTDLLQCLKDLDRKMPEDVCAYITHRILMALKTLHDGTTDMSEQTHSRTVSGASNSNNSNSSPASPHSPSGMNNNNSNNNNNDNNNNSHNKRIVHRDIKPSNILLNSAGAVKLADFGVAGSTDSIGLATFVGTTTYMCPQRIQGKSYNTPSDIWSCGTVVAEMLLGYHPFMSCNPVHFNTSPPSAITEQFPSHTTSGDNSGMSSLGNNNNTSGTNSASSSTRGDPLGSGSGGGSNVVHASPAPGSQQQEQIQFFQLFDRVTKCKCFYLGPSFSEEAIDFVYKCLQQDPDKRPTAHDLLHHRWIARFGESCPLCPMSSLAAQGRMMSNSVSGFSPAMINNHNNTNNNNSGTPSNENSTKNVMMNSSNNNDQDSNNTNSSMTSEKQHTSSFTEAMMKPPITPNDFANFVYDNRKDCRDMELAAREKEKNEKRAAKERERELRQAAKKKTSTTSSSVSAPAAS